MDFGNILGQIQTKSSVVAINISSRSTMEVVEIDKNGIINNYTIVPIQYNNLTKEIENIYDFQSSLKQAFSDLKLSLNSRVYVSIPTYVIEHENLPDVDDNESIKTMLMSSAEKNYIFKKYDPAISFFKIPTSHDDTVNNLEICYTALRADEYTKIKTVFEELGLKVLAIDSSYSSLINGIIATNKVNPNLLAQNGSWNIVNITSNSYMIFNMAGRFLLDVYEEPLAVKSFTEEEIYQVITNSLELTLGNYPANQTIVVSQSDSVSAEYLAGVIPANSPVAFIEDNKYRKQLVEMSLNITQSLLTKVSLEAVGISTWQSNVNGFKFNFLDAPIASSESVAVESITVTIDGKDVEITSEKIQRWAILIGLILCVLAGLAFGTCAFQYNGNNKEKIAVAEDINEIQNELNIQPQTTGISESEFLQKKYTDNMNYQKSYAAISREIPDMLWIEEFQMLEDSKMYLKGRSYRMEDVLNYYDSLNKLGKFPNLKISTLKVSNNEISDLLLQPNSNVTEETTYEFAFGEVVYVEPVTNDAAQTNATTDGATTPPAANNAIPPAPTNIPATN